MYKINITILLAFIIQMNYLVLAQPVCNPDPNKLITGVPYCQNSGIQTTSTEKFNSNAGASVNVPLIINIDPDQRSFQQFYPVSPGLSVPLNSYSQPQINNNSHQSLNLSPKYLPASPSDILDPYIPQTAPNLNTLPPSSYY